MKKFKVTWYYGSIECPEIPEENIIKTMEVEAKDVHSVPATDILPDYVQEHIIYTRGLIWDDHHITIDYGHYTKFIDVKEVE